MKPSRRTHANRSARSAGGVASLLRLWVWVAALAVAPVAAYAAQIGQAMFVKGAVSAQDPDGSVRLLGKDSPVYEGDVVTTGKQSFAVINLQDGTHMAFRPETVFKFEQYSTDAGRESAVMRLFKGGLRTITGFISKRNPNAYKFRTVVATIGIRGTEFDARVCTDDCEKEAQKEPGAASDLKSKVVGRIAFMKGDLTGTGTDNTTRKMVAGAPLYEGDVVATGAGSYAVLAFRDETRITLSPSTRFKIEKNQYDPAAPEKGSAIFRLLQGGLRAVTGLIGQRNHSAVRFQTAVATIGIRGTGFDLLCDGSCIGNQHSEAEHESVYAYILNRLLPAAYAAGPAEGLYARVWKGAIVLELGGTTTTVNENQIAFLDSPNGIPRFVPRLPVEFNVPRPDQVQINQSQLFNVKEKTQMTPGLYVSCYEGHCSMETPKKTVDLGAGEAAYANDQGSERIPPPKVLEKDPYFKFADPKMAPLLNVLQPTSGSKFECDM